MKPALAPTLALALTLALNPAPAGASVLAASAATDFESANRLYDQGKYPEAAAAFEGLLKGGTASAAIYYNLGNAWFKAGQIGRAVAAYRSAEQLRPRDPDLRANLQFARNQVQGPTLSAARWQRWLGRLSLSEWTALAGGAFWLVFLLLILQQLRPAIRPALRSYLVLAGMVLLVSGAGFATEFHQRRAVQTAIVITRDGVAHQGPSAQSPAAFTAHDGAELRVTDQKDEWLQVTADMKGFGWIPRDRVIVQAGR